MTNWFKGANMGADYQREERVIKKYLKFPQSDYEDMAERANEKEMDIAEYIMFLSDLDSGKTEHVLRKANEGLVESIDRRHEHIAACHKRLKENGIEIPKAHYKEGWE